MASVRFVFDTARGLPGPKEDATITHIPGRSSGRAISWAMVASSSAAPNRVEAAYIVARLSAESQRKAMQREEKGESNLRALTSVRSASNSQREHAHFH
jgi:hypothetical protein